jgi:hypothetical protein
MDHCFAMSQKTGKSKAIVGEDDIKDGYVDTSIGNAQLT